MVLWGHKFNKLGFEIGDKCNQQGVTASLGGGSYTVQEQWSNASSSCVVAYGAVPAGCTLSTFDCQGEASLMCSPTPNGLNLWDRVAGQQPPGAWVGAGFTPAPASFVDGIIIPGPAGTLRANTPYQFLACTIIATANLCTSVVSLPPGFCPNPNPSPRPSPGGNCCAACIKGGGMCTRNPNGTCSACQ